MLPAGIRVGCLAALGLAVVCIGIDAQHAGTFMGSLDDPAIKYSTSTPTTVVSDLNAALDAGRARFAFDERTGFLRSALDALQIPVDSQLLVFSRTSLQGKRISEQNPRAVFFNDRVALGWVRGGDVLEVAAQDPANGVVFYELPQRADANAGPPQFRRAFVCLGCHVTADTLGVPGLLMFSTTRAEPGQFSGVPQHIDQSDSLGRRFGGWFVTGSAGRVRHMGNEVAALDGRPTPELSSVEGLFDTHGYPSLTSDIVAHLVLTHQAGMTNLLTRAAWEARVLQRATATEDTEPTKAQPSTVTPVLDGVAREVVDHLLFVDEAPLDRVRGSSGFAERFSARGPRDRKGRSLYELDLTHRLMKYPCSYLIYSPSFDALPPAMKSAIYARLWQVLAGADSDARYRAALPAGVRRAIVEILRDTKSDLPEYFRGAVR